MLKSSCHKCGHAWEFNPPMGRGDECPQCHWDCHVCLNCRHYDRNYHHECREPEAEYVQVKDRSNFCDYFEPLANAKLSAQDQSAKQKLEQLFGTLAKEGGENPSPSKSIDDELQAFLKNKGR